MPRVINIDALVVETVTLNLRMPDGSVKTYDLRDDVPVSVGLLTFQLMQKEQDLKAAEAAGEPAFQVQGKRLEMMSADITHILGEIFRHTYPETTDGELAMLIPPSQGMEIVKVFFTSLTAKFKPLESATDSSSSPESQTPSQGRSNLPAADPLSGETPSPKPSSEPDPETAA